MVALLPAYNSWPVFLAHAVGSPEFYWALVAEGSILFWTVLLVLSPRWARRDSPPRFRTVVFGSALLASLITLIGKLLEVWPGNPLFPSGHTAYAAVIALFLVASDPRLVRVVVPLLAVLVLALVLAHWWSTSWGALLSPSPSSRPFIEREAQALANRRADAKSAER